MTAPATTRQHELMDDATPLPLPRRPCGIERFRVEGVLDTERVHAEWDGRWLVASDLLLRSAELAMAVDEAFMEAGLGSAIDRDGSAPEQLMLALVTSCDAIHIAEYQLQGHRRVIAL
jgi:hypothetical protein